MQLSMLAYYKCGFEYRSNNAISAKIWLVVSLSTSIKDVVKDRISANISEIEFFWTDSKDPSFVKPKEAVIKVIADDSLRQSAEGKPGSVRNCNI